MEPNSCVARATDTAATTALASRTSATATALSSAAETTFLHQFSGDLEMFLLR